MANKLDVNDYIVNYLNAVHAAAIPGRTDEDTALELIDEGMLDFLYIWTWDRIEGDNEEYLLKKLMKDINHKTILKGYAKKISVTTSESRIEELTKALDKVSLGELRYYFNPRRELDLEIA